MTSRDLTASAEDYLETIYQIIQEKTAARVKEIAQRMKVNNSSVTGALRALSAKGLINYTPYDVVTLTPEGESMAREILRRHEIMKAFITDILCLDEKAADEAACRMEHAVTPDVLERIIRLVEFTKTCPRTGSEWTRGFQRYCRSGFSMDSCRDRSGRCLTEIQEAGLSCGSPQRQSIPLSAVAAGHMARLVTLTAETGVLTSFDPLGITPGSIFGVDRIDPKTGDMDVTVRGHHLTLRTHEAEQILVILLSPQT